MMPNNAPDLTRLEARLRFLYGERAQDALIPICNHLRRFGGPAPSSQLASRSTDDASQSADWTAADVVLITYGDQLRCPEAAESVASPVQSPLKTLHTFLRDWRLPELIGTVHFLPCFPYTSDDGFSIVDYRKVDPALGTWEDLHAIREDFQLMLDFVANHCSQKSTWFQRYLEGVAPYDRYFIEVDPATDLSCVTRPRSSPLLTEFRTARGPRCVWTTFSSDQVDLNYAEPQVLAEMVGILLEYVGHGATIIRLDAVAYLWKEIGTNCIHLEQTHALVKLMRDVLEHAAPHVQLLTETNVPHDENVAYFGQGDEAHMVYQFSLPPLLLDAFLNEDAKPLAKWLATLESPPPGATYFNFTASHDGIGVRPLEGHVDEKRLAALVDKVRQRGGLVSTRRMPDGSDVPYELNVSYLDAVRPHPDDRELHVRRFLTTQAFMMALQGVPAIYFHSLVGTTNDYQAVAETGIARRINRRRFTLSQLNDRLNATGSLPQAIFNGLRHMLRVRAAQPAFAPSAAQQVIDSEAPDIVCFQRRCTTTGQRILVAANFGDEAYTFTVDNNYQSAENLLNAGQRVRQRRITILAGQIVWLANSSDRPQ